MARKTETLNLNAQVGRFEAHLICQTLTATRGDVRAAAKALQVGERTLWRKIRQHDIEPDAYRDKPVGGAPRKAG